MFSLKQIALASGLGLLAMAGTTPALAQSTDGFHAIQIFPVVVDSGTFTQSFVFKNPDAASAVTVSTIYFPADGTTQAVNMGCSSITIPAGGQRVFNSLRGICPTLAAGNQFGFLYTAVTGTTQGLFAGFSRATTGAGLGFSVEAFPAHTFTSANTIVTGLRRRAASAGSPAFQTNCFVANLHDVTPGQHLNSTINYTLRNSAGAAIGSGSVQMTPGRMIRMLDIFATAGAPVGNYDDASIEFEESGTGEPGLMSFCTVQDNTNFGADFRIGKQFRGYGTQYSGIGAQDDHVSRDTTVAYDIKMTGDTTPRAFSIPASTAATSANTHVVYFRHPDYVACEIIDPATNLRAVATYGLEMRLRDQYLNTLAGGANIQGFSRIYMGDKTDRNNGANARYTIEVESTAVNTAAVRPYKLHCQSGSGHTLGDIVKFNTPTQF